MVCSSVCETVWSRFGAFDVDLDEIHARIADARQDKFWGGEASGDPSAPVDNPSMIIRAPAPVCRGERYRVEGSTNCGWHGKTTPESS